MESHLPAFREKNPQLEVVAELNRGYHPLLKGLYSKISLSLSLVLFASLSLGTVIRCLLVYVHLKLYLLMGVQLTILKTSLT